MSTPPPDDTADDDMPAEVAFTAGARGMFFCAEVRVSLPVDRDAAKDIESPGADP